MASADAPIDVAPEVPPARERVPTAVLVLLLVLGLACAPWLVLHIGRMMAAPHYQFVAIVPLGALVLGWRGWQGLGQLTAGPVRGTQVLAAMAWGLLFLAGFFSSGLLGLLATLVALLAGLWALGGPVLLRAMLPAWLFLWLLFPLPLGLDLKLIGKLQSLVSWETSRVLDLLGIIHVMAGNVIEVPGRRLLVEDACSGIHSLFAVLTCTVFFVLWNRCSIGRSLFLIAAAGFWVLLANAVRVVTIAIAFTRWGVDLSAGWQHEALGWVLFAGTLGLLWSSDGLYLFFATRQREEAPAAVLPPVPATRLPAWGTLGLQRVPAIAAFGLLALLQGALFWAERTSIVPGLTVSPAEERMKSMTAESLPEKIGPWKRINFNTTLSKYIEDRIGITSRVWTYQAGPVNANVSADFFFPGWHNLHLCYGSQGWSLHPKKVHFEQYPNGVSDGSYVAVAMEKPLERFGYLWYGLLSDDGQSWPPEEEDVVRRMVTGRSGDAYRQLWARLRGDNATKMLGHLDMKPTCQVQVFIESYAPLGEKELAEGQKLFLQARELFRQRLRE